MILDNCMAERNLVGVLAVDGKALFITAVLGILYFGSGKLLKKKISPFVLILLAACMGMAVYGAGVL